MTNFNLIGPNEIVGQGVIIAKSSETVFINCAEVSPNPIKFSLIYQDNEDDYTEFEDEDFSNLYITVGVKLSRGNMVFDTTGSVGEVIIGQTIGRPFIFNYIINFVGDLEKFMFVLNYNILREND